MPFDIKEESEFIQACVRSDLEVVVTFLQKDPSLANTTASNGSYPLMFAAQNGSLALIDELLKYGAEIDSVPKAGANLEGVSALLLACYCKQWHMVKKFLENGAAKFEHSAASGVHRGKTVLWLAANLQQWDLVSLLLEKGANPNVSPEEGPNRGVTPIFFVMHCQQWDLVSLLLEKGANPNVSPEEEGSNRGVTPLWLAAKHRQWDIVRLLLEKGANKLDVGPLEGAFQGITPLWNAVYYKQWGLVSLLLAKGANPNVNPAKGVNRGMTPLWLAIFYFHWDSAQLLLDKGADPNASPLEGPTQGQSPLWLATQAKCWKIVILLLTKGAHELSTNEKKYIKPKAKKKEPQKTKKKESHKQEIIKIETMTAKNEFLSVLTLKWTQLGETSNKLQKIENDRRECEHAILGEGADNIEKIVDKLENPLKGRFNKSRLSGLKSIREILIEAQYLNNKIKADGKIVEQAKNHFAQLCELFNGTLIEKNGFDFGKIEAIKEALLGKIDAEHEAVLKDGICMIDQENKEFIEQLSTLVKSLEELKILKERLQARIEKYATARADTQNTNNELEIVEEVKQIRELLQQRRQGALSINENKPVVIRVESIEESEPMPVIEPVPLLINDNKPLSRAERRTQKIVENQLKQKQAEQKKQQEARELLIAKTEKSIAQGLFPRPVPCDIEVKVAAEHSYGLMEALENLHEIIKILAVDHEWTPEKRYALLGSFAEVNECIRKECRDRSINKVATRLRNAIYKHYVSIQAFLGNDVELLSMVSAWVQFYEKEQVGYWIDESAVLREVKSALFEKFYISTSFVDNKTYNFDVDESRVYMTSMQSYWQTRKTEDDLLANAANAFCLAVMGPEFKALFKAIREQETGAKELSTELEPLIKDADEIIALGGIERHGVKNPVLYLYGADTRLQINTEYQYEENDIQAILCSRLHHLRCTNLSDNIDLWSTDVLAAVDNMGFRQLQMQLQEDKDLNGTDRGARSVLIPCNFGNSHWVGIYLKFGTNGQLIWALYTDSLSQNRIIPKEIQEQFEAVYPNTMFEFKPLMMQEDKTSCGAYVVENLLLCVQKLCTKNVDSIAIRQLHLEALRKYRTDFYTTFYKRQKYNQSTMATLEKQLGYLEKMKNISFSKQEWYRILCIKNCLFRFSKENEKVLLKTFGKQPVDANDHALHLAMIRSVLERIVRTTGYETSRAKAVAELLLLLCGIENWESGMLLPDLEFKVGYEEFLTVANISCPPEKIKSILQDVGKQIEWGKEFALQLKAEFSACPKVYGKKSVAALCEPFK